MKTIEIKPPGPIMNITPEKSTKIFLAGTIDMGNSEDWQVKVRNYFGEGFDNVAFDEVHPKLGTIVLFNPRRDKWNPNWKQGIEEPQFYQQVNWEMNALDKSDIIILNLLPNSYSPISLLELGLYAKSGKLKVCCPEGFYRKGNVDMVCDKYGIPMYENLNKLLKTIK